MNVDHRGAMIGMVLGDGYISKTKQELSVTHSTKQRDYCEHKAGRIKQMLGGKFNVREIMHGPGKRYHAVTFVSTHSYWRILRSWCYPNGSKTYTRRLLDMLTAEGIAFWYMDDGTARRNISIDGWTKSVSTGIATMCTESECRVICDYFKEVHDIEFKIRKRKASGEAVGYFVECNTEQSRKFVLLVQPYIIPSMAYKIAHVADLSSHECRAPVGHCAACNAAIYEFRRTGLCSRCYSLKYYHEVRRIREGRTSR